MPTKQAFIDHLHRLRNAKIDARNLYESRLESVDDDGTSAILRTIYVAKTAEIELLDIVLREAAEIE